MGKIRAPLRRNPWSAPVVPAHAGLVPGGAGMSDRSPRAPRACGVGPAATMGGSSGIRWSPRLRGWPRHVPGRPGNALVVPAHAGLAPSNRKTEQEALSGPRACGVGPTSTGWRWSQPKCSPRMRGWSLRGLLDPHDHVVVPAHAGWSRLVHLRQSPREGGPRACGVGPQSRRLSGLTAEWSPRTRGWSRSVGVDLMARGVVPACAGVVPPAHWGPRWTRSGPRVCGGGPNVVAGLAVTVLWSRTCGGWPLHVARPDREALVAPRTCGPSRNSARRAPGAPRAPSRAPPPLRAPHVKRTLYTGEHGWYTSRDRLLR